MRIAIFFMIVCMTFGLVIGARAEKIPPPNVLIIRADDMARWAVGAYGDREARTPNIDRLHREGATCLNVFVTTPVCSPSRAAFMTGLYSAQLDIPDWIQRNDTTTGLRADAVTLAEVFQAAGYATAHFGKWHMGNAPEHHPTRHGFEKFAGIVAGGGPNYEPTVEVDGKTQKLEGRWREEWLGDQMIAALENRVGRPFFMMIDFLFPHAPYAPAPPEREELFKDADISIPPDHNADADRVRKLTREYYAAVATVDQQVGRILDALDRTEATANTIVVFTSDHGYMLGHHGLWHKGNATVLAKDFAGVKDPGRRRPNMFDDSLRVPLAIRWPGRVPEGHKVEPLISQFDLYPTLIEMAGLRSPYGEPMADGQARSFAAYVLGEAYPIATRDAVFGDYDMREGKRARMTMIRMHEWKLIRHEEEEGGRDELYDLKNDPGETRNRIEDKDLEDVLSGLDARLRRWREGLR